MVHTRTSYANMNCYVFTLAALAASQRLALKKFTLIEKVHTQKRSRSKAMNRRCAAIFWVRKVCFSGYLGLSVALMSVAFSSCQPKKATTNTATTDTTVTISAAASLQDVMSELTQTYAQHSPKVTIIYNFGASGALAQQIGQGAPVDIFLSASERWMVHLKEQNHIVSESQQVLFKNALVLVVPKRQNLITGQINTFQDLTAPAIKRIALGETESVPVGQYAKELLVSLNLFDQVSHKLILGKSARQVLAYVESGNVDAGLMYKTDALLSNRVKIVADGPTELHSDILYSVAIVNNSSIDKSTDSSTDKLAAERFIQFLSSEEAIATFKKYGFVVMAAPTH